MDSVGGPTATPRFRPALSELAAAARERAARVSLLTVLFGLAIAAGIALRVWVFSSELRLLDSDEAVVGLMARHMLDGEFSVFFWGQFYTGSLNALVTALAFGLLGSSTLVLKLVALGVYAVTAVLVWRVGKRTVGDSAARLGAVLFWIWPGFFVWFTTKAYGYPLALFFATASLLLILRLRERDSRRDAAALGLTFGLGWWSGPHAVLLALPAVAWLAWRRPRAFRLSWIALPAFVVGAAPWLAWNVKNDWLSLRAEPAASIAQGTYLERLGDLFSVVLPMWLGLRLPYSLDWLVPPAVGLAVVAVAIGGLLVALRRPGGGEPLLLIAVASPFLIAVSPFAGYVDEPRYLVVISPVIALLLGWLLARRGVALPALGLAVVLSGIGLALVERERAQASDPNVAADVAPLVALLEREGETRVLADYWLAYRISFESDERIIATSTGLVRYPPHDRLVRSAPSPAYAFVLGSAEERARGQALLARGYRRLVAADFAVYVHS